MKTVRHLLTGVALVLALAVLGTDGASAQQGNLWGTVTSLSTGYVPSSSTIKSGFFANVESKNCDGDETVTNRSVSFHASRPMDDSGVTMRNIYSTLLAALLSGKPVYILTQTPCSDVNNIDISDIGYQVSLLTHY